VFLLLNALQGNLLAVLLELQKRRIWDEVRRILGEFVIYTPLVLVVAREGVV